MYDLDNTTYYYSYVNQNNETIVDKVWSDKITYWTEINFEPVQTISEFRNGENLLPFNFTLTRI
jgi:hypothetical protein